ncbi:helix-turn-helix transcriptional regulator [Streptomyces sp. YIM 98790]|uniref:helix-turn-helix domain-containing protein n=1 Tax=Streptomyces sp. YIM 98790 TaxID=2689077 RepID=UPI00140BC41C|nr:helix-turn-helix transcriptional regulator [Streptomyces sp. YIM 98790]
MLERDEAHHQDRHQTPETGSDPLLRAAGRIIKRLRENAGLTQAQFGSRIGYGAELVSSVERGVRIPQEAFLDGAERVLDAKGVLASMKEDLERVRFPARFRDFAKWEKDAISVYGYSPLLVPGLLQTEDYARAVIGGNCPPLDPETIEERVTGRIARQRLLDRRPPVVFGFVIEESVLRRPVGGRDVMRRQLAALLERGRQPHVSLQVMPTERWEHNGVLGSLTLLETRDHRTIVYTETQGISGVISDRKQLSTFTQRHGIIRMQALDGPASARFIEQIAGEL